LAAEVAVVGDLLFDRTARLLRTVYGLAESLEER
jgi:hypothetical protein